MTECLQAPSAGNDLVRVGSVDPAHALAAVVLQSPQEIGACYIVLDF